MLGWLDALHPAGIDPIVVQTRNDGAEAVAEAAGALLALQPRPTAVLCFSDVIALGVVRVARGLDLDVPSDLSVIGFDGSAAARDSDPPLTTVRQDPAAKGRLAAAALTAAIAGARAGTPAKVRHRVLPTELVIGGSTSRPA